MTGHPNHHDDAAIIDALEQALDDGRTLAGNGGVVPEDVAEYCGLAESTLKGRLSQLADDDRLVVVWGIGQKPRRGYLPADHPDARQPGERGALEVADD